jgi:hypothetical protein
MESHPCFTTLDRALVAYRKGRHREALALADAAWKLTKQVPGAPTHAAVVGSWLGFLMATVDSRLRDGLKLCREAADVVFWEPRVFDHLARLEIQAGSRQRALAAVRRGLKLSPDDRDLQSVRRWLGVRRRPPIRFLHRDNPLNRLFGKLSYKQPEFSQRG